jgi:hypothetical protein
MKLATWTAGAIALGWLLTAASLTFRGGHPPAWWVMGMGVVMLSVVLAPIGAIAALLALRRERRFAIRSSRRLMILLCVNGAFLLVAVGLWLWAVLVAMP